MPYSRARTQVSDNPTCPVCTRESPDNLLCHTCTSAFEADLTPVPAATGQVTDIPTLWSELATTYQRQAQTGDGNGRRADAEVPLPFSVTAATVRDSVANTISTWIRDLQQPKEPAPEPTMKAWCAWLLERVSRIRGHEAVEQIVDEIHYAASILRSAVDRPGETTYCGKCEVCGKELRANPDAEKVTCRWCWIGGDERTYPVPKKLANMWEHADEARLTRAQILEALVYNGVPVNAATFRSWIHRGPRGGLGLTPVEHRHNGTPLYRLGDALALARAAALVPDQSKETLVG